MVSMKSFLIGILMIVFIPGCASTIHKQEPVEKINQTITSEPLGADIYWGKTKSNLIKTEYKTPFSKSLSGKSWESWCYQVKKEGYYDSEVNCRPTTFGNRFVHFKLKSSSQEQEEKTKSFITKSVKNREKLLAEYLEKQTKSSKLDPKDSLFKEAHKLYEKAKATAKYPDFFATSGTSDSKGISLLERALEANPYYHSACYVLGKSYSEIKEYAKSEELLLKCIDLKPKYQKGIEALADIYRRQKRYEDALKYYNKALIVGPPTVNIYSSIGSTYYKKGNLERAEESFKNALQLLGRKDNQDLMVSVQADFINDGLAKVYLEKGNLKTSLEYLKKAHFFGQSFQKRILPYKQYLEKGNFYAYASVGQIYYSFWKYDKAAEYLQKAYNLNPIEYDQYYELSKAYEEQKKYPIAFEYLKKAVGNDPNHYGATMHLGKIYGNTYIAKKSKIKLDHQKAIELFNKAKELKPENADPYYNLGQVYYNLENYYEAAKETQLALEIEETEIVHEQLGDIYFAAGQYESARGHYMKCIKFQRDNSLIFIIKEKLANTLLELARYREAITLLKEAIAKDGQISANWLRPKLAEVYQRKGDFSQAIQIYKKILDVNPNDFDAHFNIARCYFDLRNWDEAATWWKKAVEIKPKSHASFFNIGLAYTKNEQFDEAIYHYKKALEINPKDKKTKENISLCIEQLNGKYIPIN